MTTVYPGAIDSFRDVTDGVEDVIAADHNNQSDGIEAVQTELGVNPAGLVTDVVTRLDRSLPEADNAESATLSGTRTLTDANENIQYLNANGADREVTLPAEANTNHEYTIVNTTAADYTLTVKNDGGDVVGLVCQAQTGKFASNGTAWELVSYGNKVRYVGVACFDYTTDTATGDGKGYFPEMPPDFVGMNLVSVVAQVITAGITDTLDVQIHNVTQTADVLSTVVTIDTTELTSRTAATPYVIDTAEDDVTLGDVYRVDVDAIHSGTAAKGLIVVLGFRLP